MKLDEALKTLKKAGAKTIKESLDNVESFFNIGADVSDVDKWFYDIIADEYTGAIDVHENSAGNATVKLKGAEVSPDSLKMILDEWQNNIGEYSINVWRR